MSPQAECESVRSLQEWMQYVKEKREAADEAPQPGGSALGHQRPGSMPAESSASQPITSRPRRAMETAQPAGLPPSAARQDAPAAGTPNRPAPTEPSTFEASRRQAWEQLEEWRTKQGRLPLDIAEDAPSRRTRTSVEETREELIERLLDPQLTLREVAKLLDVCPTTVRRYTNRGVLSHYRTPGNQRRFRLSDVLEFMRRQQQR